MSELKIGTIEEQFAKIIWENEPLTSKELVNICERELHWKKPTTYTVLRKLCEKGIFKNEKTIVTSIISRDDFYAIQSEQFVEETFNGSLPAFVTAFTKRKSLSAKELEELKRLINSIE